MMNNEAVALWPLAVLCLVVSGWADGVQDAKAVISNASKALGADSLKTIEYSGDGSDFGLGQAPSPGSPWPRFIEKSYTRVIDFEAPASRMQRVRMEGENPPRGGGGGGVVNSGIIFGEQQQGQVISPGSPQARTLPEELMMAVPYSFLRSAATAQDATVTSKTVGGKFSLLGTRRL